MTVAEHVEGGAALLGEAAPVCNGEGLEEAGDAREEVFFPGAYHAFRRIQDNDDGRRHDSAMLVRQCVLEARLLRLDEFLDLMRCLIVHFVQEGFEALHRQPLICFVVCAQEFFFRPALDWYRANVVGIVDVENNDVCVAPVGGDGEPACLIAGDDTVNGMYVRENEVGACVEQFLGGIGHVIVDVEAGHVM